MRPENPLPRIYGDLISAAMSQLPDPQSAMVECMEGKAVTVDGDEVIGTFRRHVIKHPRKTYYLWSVESARYANELNSGSDKLLPS